MVVTGWKHISDKISNEAAILVLSHVPPQTQWLFLAPFKKYNLNIKSFVKRLTFSCFAWEMEKSKQK